MTLSMVPLSGAYCKDLNAARVIFKGTYFTNYLW
jgi:hypothetical protein